MLALAGPELARHASASIEAIDPSFSARRAGFGRAAAGLVAILALIGLAVLASATPVIELAVILCFLLCTVLRLLALCAPPARQAPPAHRLAARELPVYSVLVPLYREAASVRGLVGALAALDYPATKLDVRLLVECDDHETLRAIEHCALPPHFEVMRLPPGEPRTKPRALTVGLAAARGQYLVVYDAEDRPEPGQLREALALFDAHSTRLACVQARLTIDNTADNWLTRMFTIEYAGLFDAFLPGLSRLGVMFPLGGTSNHFRTAALDRAGGWDAWNVTEDADLGVRFARLGLDTRMLGSTTFEEAPNRAGAWLKQRTRWMKGYILTWAVHMRHPVRLWRDLGTRDFLAFHAIIGGVPFSALLLPLFLLYMGWQVAAGTWLSGAGLLSWALPGLAMANLVLGFATAIAVSAAGIDNRRLWALQPLLILSPFYWLLGSAAAWRAVWQLIRTPHVWEKTEHGLARTSRSPGIASAGVDLAGART